MTSNGKQFTVTRVMLTVVARDRWNLSAVFKFCFCLFCYITNHLMTGPLRNSEFCFPRISMFPETKSRETLRFEGNKIHCSPRDQSLSVNYSPHMQTCKQHTNEALSLECFVRVLFTSLHNWHFFPLINSTSNALYINLLKMTEVSVETCIINLKHCRFLESSIIELKLKKCI